MASTAEFLPTSGELAGQRAAQAHNQECRWTEIEGRVTFAAKGVNKLVLEITSGAGRISAELPESPAICLPLLFQSRVRVAGTLHNAYTIDGYATATRLLLPGPENIHLLEVAAKQWNAYSVTPISRARSRRGTTSSAPVKLRGSVSSLAGKRLSLRDESGEIVVHLAQPFDEAPDTLIEVLGQLHGAGTNLFVSSAAWRPLDRNGREDGGSLRLLRTTEEVHALKPEDADAQYAVRIRGVVTSRDANGGMVQDATRGVYVYRLKGTNSSSEVRTGDYVEVAGVTTRGTFAPMINCTGLRRLGEGCLPNPIRPTWEQLNNGSMDCQYVEIEGFVTRAYPNSLVLLMPEGHFGVAIVPEAGVDIRDLGLPRYANKNVRIRGTVFATRNNDTHRVRAGSIGLGNAVVGLGEPVITLDKKIGELLQFDARAAGFHRVKVSGQILHAREREYYVSDGTNGLRFVTRTAADLIPGDQVEVVGFPRVAGSAPVLLEASARKIGSAPLPPGRILTGEILSSNATAGVLVELPSSLLGIRSNRTDIMLDLQAGPRSLLARLERGRGELPLLPIGSRLRVTGVYAGHGRDGVTGAETDSCELLLNSPADIHILERPSWWTPARALTVVSCLIGALLLVAGWVISLRRKVEARTGELKDEIEERKRAQAEVEHVHKELIEQIVAREHAERQHLLEAERSRLARDLHDELGSSLTEISLLANGGAGAPPTLNKATERLRQIADKAAGVVDGLDVIVWAVNPATDALQPLADYVSSFAREFLSACGIRCRLKVPIEFPIATIESHTRHNLFLAVKESLNNAARHSSATEVEFRMAIVDRCLQITVTDNGVGFDTSHQTTGLGLANLRRRLEAIGGQCSIESRPRSGTAVTLFLPLTSDALVPPNLKEVSV